jgi:hypothetical protein
VVSSGAYGSKPTRRQRGRDLRLVAEEQGRLRIREQIVAERNNLAALSKQQNQAATGDAVGVFLIGVPASSTFGGDKEGVLAVSKGKVNAIEASLKSKGCK